MSKESDAICWPGAIDHEGHTITPTDVWESQIESLPDGRSLLTCGRVRCSCGVEWNVGGWGFEHLDALSLPPASTDGAS